MQFSELIVYIMFVVGFALTPGPNMMLYLTYTFEFGRRAGWATAAGIVSAFVIHITLLVLGLTALLIALPHGLIYIKYAGIAYLFYLAYKNLKTVSWKQGDVSNKSPMLSSFYLKGFFGNLLNPGSVFLYFSLIPQFIQPERGHVIQQNIMLGCIQMLFSFITNCFIVDIAGFVTEKFFSNEQYQRVVRYSMSLLIIVFALRMLFFRIH